MSELTFHHLNHSQSQRILWLLEELSLAYSTFTYTLVHHFRAAGESPASLKAVSPTGKAPCLVLPNGRRLFESTAIIDHLFQTYDTKGVFAPEDEEDGKGAGARAYTSRVQDDPNDWLRAEEMSSFGASSLGFLVQFVLILGIIPSMAPFFLRPFLSLFFRAIASGFQPRLKAAMSFLDEQLEGREYFGGSRLGKADFATEFSVSMCKERGMLTEADGKRVWKWLERCQGREGWKRALSKGNGYDLKNAF